MKICKKRRMIELRTYEIVSFFTPQMAGEVLQQGKSVMEAIVQKQGGKVINVTDLGKRMLGYRVKKMNEGYCLVFDCELEPSSVAGLKHALQLTDEVLKFTVVTKAVLRARTYKRPQKEPAVQAGART